MKFNLYSILLLLLVANFISCNKPPYYCDTFGDHSIEIKFLNQQGQNLIFGSNRQFQLDSIRLLNQINNYTSYNASHQRGFVDSNNVIFHFYVPESKSYIYYNQQTPMDSLEIKWVTKTAKCDRGGSLEVNVVDSVKFNNALIKPVNGVYSFVK
jgi:hypothetical protein